MAAAFLASPVAFGQTTRQRNLPSRQITVITSPGTNVFFGMTGDGRLVIRSLPAGSRTFRLKRVGSKEIRRPLSPMAKGEITITLLPTTDEAEPAPQEAEAQ